MSSFARRVVVILMIVVVSDIVAAKGRDYYPNERNELLRLRDAFNSTAAYLRANWTGVPCGRSEQSRWAGISCSNWHVVQVNLNGLQLTGSLPPNFLRNITYLTRLSLKDNSIFGSLPDLSNFDYLQHLILSQNQFSSSIPYGYINLPRLSILELEENYLDGRIPPFNQDSLAVFNVSNNNLDGQIPETSALRRFSKSSFDKNNPSLCGSQLGKPCAPPPSPPPPPQSPPPPSPPGQRRRSPPPPTYRRPSQDGGSSDKKLKPWSVGLIAAAAAFVPISAMAAFFCLYKGARKKEELQGRQVSAFAGAPLVAPAWEEKKVSHTEGVDDTERTVELQFFDKSTPVFDLDDLLRASAEILGKGKSGTTYKAVLETGSVVVVKRLKEVTGLTKKDYLQQMQILGRMKHENLVQIISFYYSKDEKLVVCEFVSHGNLYDLLHETGGAGKAALDWKSRLYVIKDIAKGLNFLHQNSAPNKVPHGNLKSSNVLIQHSRGAYHAKLADFGYLPLFPSRKLTQTLAVGMSPEFAQFKRATSKTDVYCFGIVLLEIITGRDPHGGEPVRGKGEGEFEYEDGTTSSTELVEWVRSVVNNDWSTDVLDVEIVGAGEGHDEMLKLTEIALHCTDLNPERRPRMSEVLRRIEEIEIGN
uniref:Protein kinase domain-containing protein n=1 Tax=Kalanchoe fedtschenkoi TaxID=63787 RepID=A0A7N0U5G4_KALFE